MLPSIRLIAATFLCGFAIVFAGLRIAASLNDIHQGLPVIAAQAAPLAPTPIADRQTTDSRPAAPVLYDLRFVVSNTAFTPTLASLSVPAAPPLDITPPAIEKVSKEELPAPPGATTAKSNDEPPIATAAPAAPASAPPAPDAAPQASPQASPSAPVDTPPEAVPDKQSAADSVARIASLTTTEDAPAPTESVAAPAIETTAVGTGDAHEDKSVLAVAAIEPEPQFAAPVAEPPRPEQAPADVASPEQPNAPSVQVILPMPHARPERTNTARSAAKKHTRAAHKKRVRVAQRAPAPPATTTFATFGGFGSSSTRPFGTTR
jgi:hypothetical protein